LIQLDAEDTERGNMPVTPILRGVKDCSTRSLAKLKEEYE